MEGKNESVKKNWFARHKVLTTIGGLFIFLVLIGSLSSKTPSSTSTNTGSTTGAATPTPSPTFELAAFYDAVKTGMTKAQVISAGNGTQPTNCSVSEVQGFGNSEYCSWNKGFNTVTIMFSNDAVASKSKTGF